MIDDAIVVGAGLSGLVCARRLIAAGARVRVVEARDRVGGRLANGRLAEGVVDLGGQWMSVGQPRLAALAAELGVTSLRQHREGRAHLEGPTGLFAQLTVAIAQWRSVRRIGRMVRGIPSGEPGKAREAAALDAMSLTDWLERSVAHPIARERLAMHAEMLFAADPADLSLLDYLARLGATGGFAPPGPDLPGGGREHRFDGGAHQLAARIADELGDAVRLATPITAIERTDDAIIARGAESYAARRIVLAIPPVFAHRIAGALAPTAAAFAAASRMGSVVKCFAAYDRAFWRDDGWSGEAYLPRGTVRAIVDVSGHVPTLLAFVVGSAAAGWSGRDPAERRAEILATLADRFGDRAAHPIDYLEVDWGVDPWSAGCVASTRLGALAGGATWRAPHDRVHLAGTESAVSWPGYMEGAIEAGERAAKEVLAALGRRDHGIPT